MAEQYDYESRMHELIQGIDITFKNILEPFVYDNILQCVQATKTNVSILDVGCGCGYLTHIIAKKFMNSSVEGMDISEAAIDCAKTNFNNSNLRFGRYDITEVDENQQYDIVIYNMVLHNLEQLEPAIKKTNRILKLNGIVLITIPHPVFWLVDKVKRGKIVLEEPFNYNFERFYKIPFQIINGSKHKSELTYYHRKLTTYLNVFSEYLTIVKFEEVDYKNGFPTMLRIILQKNI